MLLEKSVDLLTWYHIIGKLENDKLPANGYVRMEKWQDVGDCR